MDNKIEFVDATQDNKEQGESGAVLSKALEKYGLDPSLEGEDARAALAVFDKILQKMLTGSIDGSFVKQMLQDPGNPQATKAGLEYIANGPFGDLSAMVRFACTSFVESTKS